MSDMTSGWSLDKNSPEVLKFDLFVKSREIKQIVGSLQQILLLPAKEKSTWIKMHEAMIGDLMDSFMDDSILAMDGLQLDQESMNLSVELVTHMRDAMNMINSIFSEQKRLVS